MATPDSPFAAIAPAALARVTGGRLIASKGPDPEVVRGIQALAQVVVEVGPQLAIRKQAQGQQLTQLVQQLLGRRTT